jgi:hypothetical protein
MYSGEPHKWRSQGRDFFILGSVAMPVEDIRIVDQKTEAKITRVRNQIMKLSKKIDKLLADNFDNFEKVSA